MNVGSDWYNGVVKTINSLKDSLCPMDSIWSKFVSNTSTARLDPLLSATQRIDQFSPECTQCQIFRNDIDTLMKYAPDAVQQGDKKLVRSFLNGIDRILGKMTGHFQKEHRLVSKNHYKELFGVLGLFIVMTCQYAFSYIVHSFFYSWYLWYIGAGVGVAVGYFFDARAKREDRILYNQVPSWYSKRALIFILFFVVVAVIALICGLYLSLIY